jgi:hypothetical protein
MNLDYLRGFCQEKIAEHPDLKIAILELYWLAQDEIQDGASVSNEVTLAIESINQLIEDVNESQVGWDVAKNHPHDICGILNHEEYWYKKENGIYYPQLRKS